MSRDLKEYCEEYVELMGKCAEGPFVYLGLLLQALGVGGLTVLLDRRPDVPLSFYGTPVAATSAAAGGNQAMNKKAAKNTSGRGGANNRARRNIEEELIRAALARDDANNDCDSGLPENRGKARKEQGIVLKDANKLPLNEDNCREKLGLDDSSVAVGIVEKAEMKTKEESNSAVQQGHTSQAQDNIVQGAHDRQQMHSFNDEEEYEEGEERLAGAIHLYVTINVEYLLIIIIQSFCNVGNGCIISAYCYYFTLI